MEGTSQRRRNLLKLNTHFIWATKDRLPLIEAEQERSLYRFIETVFQRYNGTVLAIGGMADHIHILVSFSPKFGVSEVIKNVKGSSALPHFWWKRIFSEQFSHFAPSNKYQQCLQIAN